MRLPTDQQTNCWRLICTIFLLALLMVLSHDALAEQDDKYPFSRYLATQRDSFGSFFPPKEDLQTSLEKFIGIPYRWGGASERGMDCSGLTKYVYAHFLNVKLPHNSAAQCKAEVLEEISSSGEDLETGDLLFFGPGKKRINHVGIYLSDGKFIHASRSLGVRISCLERSYWNNRLMATKRLKNAKLPTASLQRASQTFGLQNFFALSMTEPWERSLQTLEVGCSSPLLDSLNLSLDAFLQMTPATSGRQKRTLTLDGWDEGRFDMLLTLETQQGFRLCMDLSPFSWLRITPSVTYLNYLSAETDLPEAGVQVLGLETLLRPPTSRWSFAMSAQTANQGDFFSWPPRSSPSRNASQITFALGVNLSDSLAFSLIGMNRDNEMRDISDDDGKLLPFLTDFAFEVGFAF